MNEAEHRELREMLGALVLGGLSADEAARVRAHLETCADCRAEHDVDRTGGARAGPARAGRGGVVRAGP